MKMPKIKLKTWQTMELETRKSEKKRRRKDIIEMQLKSNRI